MPNLNELILKLAEDDETIRRDAVKALMFLCGDERVTLDLDSMRTLISLLTVSDTETKRYAFGTLANLILKNPEYIDQILESGAIPAAIRLLSDAHKMLVSNILAMFHNLLLFKNGGITLLIAGLMDPLKKLLENSSGRVLDDAKVLNHRLSCIISGLDMLFFRVNAHTENPNEENAVQIKKELQTLFSRLESGGISIERLIEERALKLIYDLHRLPDNQSISDEATKVLRYYYDQVKPRDVSLKKSFNIVELDEIETDEHRLGQGTFGVVYKAMWRSTQVAIKKPVNISSLSKHKSFFHEAYIHAQLDHPCVVKLLSVCLTPDHYSFALELMDSNLEDVLKDMLKHNKVMPLGDAFAIATSILAGVAYMHQQGIIHSDLKNNNILYCPEKGIKIADFGSAIHVSEKEHLLAGPFGALRWRAPEAFAREAKPSIPADIYALGYLLWGLLTCKSPHWELKTEEVKLHVLNGERDKIPSTTPDDYKTFIQACWEQEPEKRPTNLTGAREMFGFLSDSVCANQKMLKRAREEAFCPTELLLESSSNKSVCFSDEVLGYR